MDNETKQFHSLTSFVIRTFFFVYLGMMVSFQRIEFILIGIVVLFALLILRYGAVLISTFKGGFEKDDRQTMVVLMPRGLAAAILAINFGPGIIEQIANRISGPESIIFANAMDSFFKDVAFVVILGTAIITTIGVSIISHSEKKKMKPAETTMNTISNQNNETK